MKTITYTVTRIDSRGNVFAKNKLAAYPREQFIGHAEDFGPNLRPQMTVDLQVIS